VQPIQQALDVEQECLRHSGVVRMPGQDSMEIELTKIGQKFFGEDAWKIVTEPTIPPSFFILVPSKS